VFLNTYRIHVHDWLLMVMIYLSRNFAAMFCVMELYIKWRKKFLTIYVQSTIALQIDNQNYGF